MVSKNDEVLPIILCDSCEITDACRFEIEELKPVFHSGLLSVRRTDRNDTIPRSKRAFASGICGKIFEEGHAVGQLECSFSRLNAAIQICACGSVCLAEKSATVSEGIAVERCAERCQMKSTRVVSFKHFVARKHTQ